MKKKEHKNSELMISLLVNRSSFYTWVFILSVALKYCLINMQNNTQFICVPYIKVTEYIIMQ